MQFKMFHRPRPRQFNYKPIYYDPSKDADQPQSKDDEKLRVKFRHEVERNSRRGLRRKNINITIYLVIIVLLIYFIFFS